MMFRQFDHFLPHPARISEILPESDDTRTFVLKLEPPVFAFDVAGPGQFAMLSLLGHGEAAFTLSGLPGLGAEPGTVVLTVRRIGSLTSALFGLKDGALVGVRGPFGRGFPQDDHSRPTVYVAGGCGLSPLKAAIDQHIARRSDSTRLAVIYGAREPRSRIHRSALGTWSDKPGITLIECVEHDEPQWPGRVGMVADFVDEAVATLGARRAVVCGPPPMLAAVAGKLVQAGIDPTEIFIAVERYMKCGTGHCGHCYINHRYVCRDGPVFPLAELQRLPDALRDEAAIDAGDLTATGMPPVLFDSH